MNAIDVSSEFLKLLSTTLQMNTILFYYIQVVNMNDDK